MFTLATILVVVLLAATVGGALLWSDDQKAHEDAANAQLQVQIEGRQTDALQAQVKSLQAQTQHPTLSIWNSCSGPCSVAPSSVLVGGVPDTFVVHFAYTATVPVTLAFLGYHQWTEFDTCGFQLSCITGSFQRYPAATQQKIDFNQGAGCAGYVYVLSSSQPGTLQPNVSATYQPASQPTGNCAHSS